MKISTLAVGLIIPVALIQAQSPLSGLAHGIIIQQDDSHGLMRMKPAGDNNVVPFTNMDSLAPTYTVEALLHHLSAQAPSAALQFEMSAISTGNDNLPIEAGPSHSGNPEPPYWQVTSGGWSGWAAIALSVTGNPGDPIIGSVFDERFQSTGGAGIGSDLFSYWFGTNVDLPPSLIDAAHFDVGYEHMGAIPSTQVTGLDTYMPAVVEARGVSSNVVPVINKWFFALTPTTVGNITSNWGMFENAFDCQLSEIGTNYVYTASWTSAAKWSQVSVKFSPTQLGLGQECEIDAIAFFDVQNHNSRIVFSLSLASSGQLEQLLVGGENVLGATNGNKPLRAQGGTKITAKIGIGNDTDVDSICTYDPENPSYAYGHWIALPVSSSKPSSIGCSAARYRSYDRYGNDVGEELLLQASNLPREPAIVTWTVAIDGAPPIVVRKVRTGERTQEIMSLPPGMDNITISATYISRTQILHSWSVQLLKR